MKLSYADRKQMRQYIEQAGRHCAGLIKEARKLREFSPEPFADFDDALAHLEEGARIMHDLCAAMHYAAESRTAIEDYGDNLARAKSGIMFIPEREGLDLLFPPSTCRLDK